MSFPAPIAFSTNCTRWRLSDLERYEARLAGDELPLPRPAENERYLSARHVAARYGTSVPTVWRWAQASKEDAA